VNGQARHWYEWLRIEIERKTDILAFAAFVISITGLTYQLYGFFRRPSVVQFAPEQVLFFRVQNWDKWYVHMAARMTYVNKGAEGKNAVVKSERIVFALATKTYELKWQYFGSFQSAGNRLIPPEHPDGAKPVSVKAGETFSEEVHFVPRTLQIINDVNVSEPFKNFLPWDDFVRELAKLREFDIRIITEFYGLKDQEIDVFVHVTPELIQALSVDKWDAPSCWAREQAGRWPWLQRFTSILH